MVGRREETFLIAYLRSSSLELFLPYLATTTENMKKKRVEAFPERFLVYYPFFEAVFVGVAFAGGEVSVACSDAVSAEDAFAEFVAFLFLFVCQFEFAAAFF